MTRHFSTTNWALNFRSWRLWHTDLLSLAATAYRWEQSIHRLFVTDTQWNWTETVHKGYGLSCLCKQRSTSSSYLDGSLLTILTVHETVKRILRISDDTGKHARWHLQRSEFVFGVVHFANIGWQDAAALFVLLIKGAEEKSLDNEVHILALLTESFEAEEGWKVDQEEQVEEITGAKHFMLYLSEVISFPNQIVENEADMPKLFELIQAHALDTEVKLEEKTVGKPNSAYS